MTGVRSDPRRVLARHGLAAKKSWGQNFLHDRSVLGAHRRGGRRERR